MKENKKSVKSTENTISFETFRKFGSYEESLLRKEDASCVNGVVSIRKYKVTIELVDEQKEVLSERLQKLWDECDNWHHWNPIKKAALGIGYELKGGAGSQNKRKPPTS